MLTNSCGKEHYKGENYICVKWEIKKAVGAGLSLPAYISPGYIQFNEDGTGHFYFKFEDDTLDTDFAYTIDYFSSPWPQDKHPEDTGESNGPNRITLYNCIMGDRLMWQYGTINFSIEYIKKKKKMTLLYDELFNSTTPFSNAEGTMLYLICEADE